MLFVVVVLGPLLTVLSGFLAQYVLLFRREREKRRQLEGVLAQLRRAGSQLMRVEDEERRVVARDLHDGAAQLLTSLSLKLSLLAQSRAIAGDDAARLLVAEIGQLLKNSHIAVRSVSNLLHSRELGEFGLPAALRSWAWAFSKRAGIPVQVDIDDPGDLNCEVKSAIFRIAQEALANVQQHSGSGSAMLRLSTSTGSVQLEVEDTGRGMAPDALRDVESAPERLGLGILGMRVRAGHVGGSLQLVSNGTGTIVRAVFPRQVLA